MALVCRLSGALSPQQRLPSSMASILRSVLSRSTSSIAGTAPSYRSAIYLHSSVPPSAFPAKVKTPVSQELQLRLIKQGGFVNWVWYGDGSSGVDPSDQACDASTAHSATVFTATGERIDIPTISIQNMDDIEQELRQRVENPTGLSTDQIHLFVCSHMARDCRCGEKGGAFVKALRAEVDKRKALDPSGPYNRFKIGEVAHVGQHKFAPNLLIHPHGDWLGLLEIDDIPTVLDRVVEASRNPFGATIGFPKAKWRGRMCLSKDEQLALYQGSK